MKRKGYIMEQIADIDNLRWAFYKAQKGKSARRNVVLFREQLDRNLLQLRGKLLDGVNPFGAYRYFCISEPKRRVICAADFSERVLHHAIMNVCGQDFDKRQIACSCACRRGKGTFAAVETAERNQRRYAWYLKLDVRKYFDSIDHDILFGKLEGMYKDRRLLNLFWQVIDSYHATDGKGLPVGNLTSQYFANHYLSFADRYLTEKLRIPAYIRYMDDMLLWSDSRDELADKGKMLEEFINSDLKLTLKPAIMNRSEHGLSALGFRYFPNRMQLNRTSRKRFSKKLNDLHYQFDRCEIDEAEFARRAQALYAFVRHATKQPGLDAVGSNRVLRGGSYNNNATNAQVSYRNNNTPSNTNTNYGFRLACSTKQKADFEQASITFPPEGVKCRDLACNVKKIVRLVAQSNNGQFFFKNKE